MNISRSFVILLVVCVSLLAAQTGWAQTDVAVKIYCAQTGQQDSVTIGVRTDASNSTNSADSANGEAVNFPPPGPGFDFRCESYPPYDTLANDPVSGGSYVNYHKLVFDGQKDMFKIGFKPDDATTMTLSWPAGLAGVGAGYWVIKDDGGATTAFTAVDMTTTGSIVIPTDPLVNPPDGRGLYHVYIVKGDAAAFHTATVADIAGALDSKGKPKAEKYKPYNSEAHFTVPAPAFDAQLLHVEFSQGILQVFAVSSNATLTSTLDGKLAKLDFAITGPAAPVDLYLKGAKGKDLIMKKFYWKPAVLPLKWRATVVAGVPGTGLKLWYKYPNWNNVGQEIYVKGAGAQGIVAGLITPFGRDEKNKKDAYRFIYHPKWNDIQKTLGVGKGGPSAVAAACMQTVAGKIPVKGFKSLKPDKYGNVLINEILALKFNLLMSDYGFTGTGLRTAMAKASGLGIAYVTNDITLDQLAVLADSVLSCANSLADPVQVAAALNSINGLFSGPFDTVGEWATMTHVKPIKKMAEQSLLYRTSLLNVAPLTGPSYNSLPEVPEVYSLNQNYPNPFNPTTTIEFSLAQDAIVTLKIYNVLGQEVATLLNHEQMDSGEQYVDFNAQDLASGVYYYRLVVNDGQFQQVKKMMLVK